MFARSTARRKKKIDRCEFATCRIFTLTLRYAWHMIRSSQRTTEKQMNRMPCSATAAEIAYDGGGDDPRTEAEIAAEASEYITAVAFNGRLEHNQVALDVLTEIVNESFGLRIKQIVAETAAQIHYGRADTDEAARRIAAIAVEMIEDAARDMAVNGF